MSGSNASDTDSEEFPFDYRTTNDRFQEKLREAQESVTNRLVERDLGQDQNQASGPLVLERDALEIKVKAVENEVAELKQKLKERIKRREYEAGLTKMTPEERADAMEMDQPLFDDDINDTQVIFDYLINIGSAPAPTNAADFSGSNFVQPHAEVREKAIDNPKVLEQIDYSKIKFTKADNQVINPQGENTDIIRQFDLSGISYDQEFSISFKVLESNVSIQELAFQVGVDMQIDTAPLLESIKEECNLIAFFRLLIHYAKLDHERKTTFEKLKSRYDTELVTVEQVSSDQLTFKSTVSNNSLEISLIWRTELEYYDKVGLGLNLCELVLPVIQIQIAGVEMDDGIDKIHETFQQLLRMRGAFLATQHIINTAFVSSTLPTPPNLA